MSTSSYPCFLILALATLSTASAPSHQSNPWLTGVRTLLEDCPVRSAKVDRDLTPSLGFVKALSDCARKRALRAIDDILQDDVIPIVEGLDLVKYRYAAVDSDPKQDNNTLIFNIRKLLKRIHDKHLPEQKKQQPQQQQQHEEKTAEEGTWREKLMSRLARVLRSHVIKIDVDRLRPSILAAESGAVVARSARSDDAVEPRGRRRRRHKMSLMPIALMGVLLMGTVLIPMGFQFLAVLGGKALILAKMALMLSSIQGLKKIATNGVNYGLYHSPVPEPWHERSGGPPHYEVLHNPPVGHPPPPQQSYLDFISRSV